MRARLRSYSDPAERRPRVFSDESRRDRSAESREPLLRGPAIHGHPPVFAAAGQAQYVWVRIVEAERKIAVLPRKLATVDPAVRSQEVVGGDDVGFDPVRAVDRLELDAVLAD